MDKLHSNENNPETGFEREDLAPRSIYAFLIGMALFATLAYFVLDGFYRFLNAYEKPQATPNALALNQKPSAGNETNAEMTGHIDQTFPDPRLERNERTEINDFRSGEDKFLNSYGWVDKPGGATRIPIERAMELIVQRGLPTRPQTGTVPASTVQVTREAAKKSDTSRVEKKK